MKHPFLKSALVISSVAILMSCSDDAAEAVTNNTIPDPNAGITSSASTTDPTALVATEPCFVFQTNDQVFLINGNLEVKNAAGTIVGTYDAATMSIKTLDGQTMFKTVDIATMEYKEAGEIIPIVIPVSSAANTILSSAAQGNIVTSSATAQSNASTTSSATQQNNQTPASSAANNNNNQQQAQSSSAQQQQSGNGKCGNGAADPWVNLKGANGEQFAYNDNCELVCHYDPTGKNCANAGAGSTTAASSNSQQQQQAKSSSSQQQQQQAKSSSSQQQAKSSSSQQSQSSQISSNYTIKYVNGGKSGSGYATRYWDCCEPHCAWPEHGGKASTCDASGNKVAGGSQSMCDGGNAGICRNQFPIVVNDNLAFAFAATPGGENNCGKCFDLAFTGEGKYATNLHKKLVGKHLIVMSSNVGYDVAGGQFDVMIPGGGYGIFDGCSAKMGWGSQGSQYGGLLDECEKESSYKSAKYKECLIDKCNKSFSMDTQAREGCLFMANWMEAAGNPLLTYKEVECPQELIDRF